MMRKILLFLFLFFPIVIPNSLRNFTLPMFMAVCAFTFIFKFQYIGKKNLYVYLSFTGISLLYIIIGSSQIDLNAIYILTFVYILAPLLWLSFWSYLLSVIDIKEVIKIILIYGVIGVISIAFFYYSYVNLGIDSLEWLIEVPNISVQDGRAAATMHVFGSLIFIVSAFVAAPGVIANQVIRTGLLITFVIGAFFSGRSAFMVALFIGAVVNLFEKNTADYMKIFKNLFYVLILIGIILTLSEILAGYLFNGSSLDILGILEDLFNKIKEGGGEERVLQWHALIDGIFESWLLGAGHGSSVAIIRNDISPWKYELLWLSTFYHVGIFGFMVYISPLLFSIWTYIKLGRLKQKNAYDIFIFTGLISISIASMTNPYLESFDFQWMVIFPCVYFSKRYYMLTHNNFNK